MARASYKYVWGKSTADISVSEGIAPSTYFLPDHWSLSTLWYHSPEDPRYEVLIPKGTILTLIALDSDGSQADDGTGTPYFRPCTSTGKPVGVAQYHLFRPFDKGTSQGAGWIRFGYIKYPFIPAVLTPGDIDDDGSPATVLNDSIGPGDYVMSDDLGRFTKWVEQDATHAAYGYPDWARMGQVIDIQKFGVTYETQLMEYLKFKTDDFQDTLNTLTQDQPYLASAAYEAMFETGVTTSPYDGLAGIDDALDRYGAQGVVTIALSF